MRTARTTSPRSMPNADLAGGYERTRYAMRRDTIGLTLDMKKVVEHLGLTPHTDADIDEVLDQE